MNAPTVDPRTCTDDELNALLTAAPILRREFDQWNREHKREAHTIMNGALSRRVVLARARARDILAAREVDA